MAEKGVALFVGAQEGESYWQPRPSTGYVTVKISPYNSPNDLVSAGVQVLEPGSSVRRHAHERANEILFVFEGEGKAEIEEVLLKHPAVAECSVVGRPHAEWGEEVVAFIVKRKDVSQEELDKLCLDNIARFKRPREYRFVETLPKNNYGKVLKTELRRLLAP